MSTARFIEKTEWKDILRFMRPENALALELALGTGLRISDALSIKKADVEKAAETDGHIRIIESKTGKARRVYVGAKMQKRLRGMYKLGTEYVFAHRTRTDAHRTREAVYKDLCRVADMLRLQPGVATHSARKSYAVEYMRAGHNLEQAMRLLRHASPGVTAIYAFADVLSQKSKK